MTDILSDDHVLCYVAHGKAYFTDDLDNQWGDDWDDVPYEHNAERPHFGREHDTTTVKTLKVDGLREPYEIHGGINSPWSVQDINGGAVPWLKREDVEVYAGTTMREFVRKVYGAGGVVFHPGDDQRLLRPEDEMTDSTWIDARERKPRNMDVVLALHDSGSSMVAMHHLNSCEFVCLRSGESWGWGRVTHWMPLPPLPERDESKAMLEDVLGGEWERVMPNCYDCGDVHATVREHMVQVEYMTDDTTLCVTVHYEEGQSVRKALEILRDELREMHGSVVQLLDVDA